jgi:hypothetical protein
MIGQIIGVKVGQVFDGRKALHNADLHRGLMRGIAPEGASTNALTTPVPAHQWLEAQYAVCGHLLRGRIIISLSSNNLITGGRPQYYSPSIK